MKVKQIVLLLFFLSTIWINNPSLIAQPISPPGPFTKIATQSGDWNNTATWGNNPIPQNGDIVHIPAAINVVVRRQEGARIKYIQIDGELRMTIHSNTRLLVETMVVRPTGSFNIGLPGFRVNPNRKAEIVFISDGPINTTWDPQQVSKGLISAGQIGIYGHIKSHMIPVKNNVAKNQRDINPAVSIPSDWRNGDEVVLTGGHFRRNTSSQDELKTISSISASLSGLTVNSNWQYDHFKVRKDMDYHLANLSRNVIFRSEKTNIAERGHIMFINPAVIIEHAAFINIGRTDKTQRLDDIVVNDMGSSYTITTPPVNQINNRRGRYSIHFHLNGIRPGLPSPSRIKGCVVRGTAGWGFVNHSSHVDFTENVCYDFVGAAFVTESGDELGRFENNIAIRGTGNGEYRPARIVFENPDRPQPLSDFGFSGDGFWFQGPAIRAVNNVASACNGAGMIWFTTGAPDIRFNRYVGFPRSAVSTVYAGFPDLASHQPRHWDYSVDSLVISDLPILECRNFQAYGCLVGFRLRFNNFNNIDWYTENPFDYDDEIVPLISGDPRFAVFMRQKVEGLKLWNNEQGFRTRYNRQTDWIDVSAINRLDYHPTQAYAGAEFMFVNGASTFHGLVIDGYAIAGWIESGIGNTRSEYTFTKREYSNYASFDIWYPGRFCNPLTGVNVSNIASEMALVSWNSNANHNRYLIRYKPNNYPHWSYATTTTTTTNVVLRKLMPLTTYTVQVIAACDLNVSGWTTAITFTTTSQRSSLTPPTTRAVSGEPSLFPNPVSQGTLYLQIPDQLAISDIRIIDAQGRLLARPHVATAISEGIAIDELPISTYWLQLTTTEGVKTLPFVIKE